MAVDGSACRGLRHHGFITRGLPSGWKVRAAVTYGYRFGENLERSTVTDDTPSYAPGTPLWVDHTSPDVQAAVSFYSDLFGWQAQDMGEEAGHYTMFSSNGKVVAATTPPMSPGNPRPGRRTSAPPTSKKLPGV